MRYVCGGRHTDYAEVHSAIKKVSQKGSFNIYHKQRLWKKEKTMGTDGKTLLDTAYIRGNKKASFFSKRC